MRYVGERELVYDPSELGFPSISGCHAILLVTAQGLFGFHNLGNERPGDWPALSGAWGQFVTTHVRGGRGGRMLYGVCYPETKRGYTGVKKAQWLAELAAFADKVGYTGPIWGYDLANAGIAQGSSYVHFTHMPTLGTCVIQARGWSADIDEIKDDKGANDDPSNHKTTRPAQPIAAISNAVKITRRVGTAAMKTYYPERLR